MKYLFFIFILSGFFGISGCSPSFEEGVSAYTIGDYPKAYKIIKEYADKNNADAQNYLGELYAHGQGVAKDAEKAAEWYQKAANQGHASAQNNLGIAYSKAIGVNKDSVYAMALFRHAAEQKHIDAQNNLGGILITGQGVERNIKEGIRWIKAAAKQGSGRAQYNLGMLYSNGMGVKKDLTEGAHWLEMASKSGHLAARNSLAWIYATCTTPSLCNGKKAVALAESVVIKRQTPQFLDTLAAAYARMGRFDAAIKQQRQALRLAKNQPRLIQEFTLRLGEYMKNKPWPPTEKTMPHS